MSVATTYAEALFEAANDARAVREVADGLRAFRSAMDEVPELRQVLHDPEIGGREKKALIAGITEGGPRALVNFLQLLVDRRRFDELAQIADAFEEQVARAEGRVDVEAVTAVPLSDELRTLLVERIQAQTGRQVSLSERVDPDIVGGLQLLVGNVLVDGSVRYRLADLRRELTAAPVDAGLASGQ